MKPTLSNVQYQETHRGVAFQAILSVNGVKIAVIDNRGVGGATTISCYDNEKHQLLNELMQNHFKHLGWNTEGIRPHSLEYTFAEHLLDIHDFGAITEENLVTGFSS